MDKRVYDSVRICRLQCTRPQRANHGHSIGRCGKRKNLVDRLGSIARSLDPFIEVEGAILSKKLLEYGYQDLWRSLDLLLDALQALDSGSEQPRGGAECLVQQTRHQVLAEESREDHSLRSTVFQALLEYLETRQFLVIRGAFSKKANNTEDSRDSQHGMTWAAAYGQQSGPRISIIPKPRCLWTSENVE